MGHTLIFQIIFVAEIVFMQTDSADLDEILHNIANLTRVCMVCRCSIYKIQGINGLIPRRQKAAKIAFLVL